MRRLARISFNSSDWHKPTGEARECETPGTCNYKQGFGHEDWLFRSEWQIDGWRYAFIEGVNRSHRRLVKENKPFDLIRLVKLRDFRKLIKPLSPGDIRRVGGQGFVFRQTVRELSGTEGEKVWAEALSRT